MPSWTYTGPTASEIADALPGSSRTPSNGWWSLRGWCHGSGGKRGSTSCGVIDDPEGQGIRVKCQRDTCDRPTIIAALELATGKSIWEAWTRAPSYSTAQRRRPPDPLRRRPTPTPSTPAQGDGQAKGVSDLARRIWRNSTPIPSGEAHPARLWVAARQLWRTDVPVPSALRWSSFSKGPAREGGAIVACFAPLDAWRTARPSPPTPTAVECIFIDGDGRPTLDRSEKRDGRSKRTYGARLGTACVIGESILDGNVAVVEGIADGLAVAARRPSPVVVCAGTAGLRNDALADALAQAQVVDIFADNEENGAGVDAAHHLRESLSLRGGTANVLINGLFKDAADVAAKGSPFPDVDGDLLAEEAERWRSEGRSSDEALRLASIFLS